MFHGGGHVDLADTTEQTGTQQVQSTVDTDAADAVPGMDKDRGGSATIRFVDLSKEQTRITVGRGEAPSELEETLGTGRGGVLLPGEIVELGDGAGLAVLEILKVEGTHEVVVTPDVLGDQVDLNIIGY